MGEAQALYAEKLDPRRGNTSFVRELKAAIRRGDDKRDPTESIEVKDGTIDKPRSQVYHSPSTDGKFPGDPGEQTKMNAVAEKASKKAVKKAKARIKEQTCVNLPPGFKNNQLAKAARKKGVKPSQIMRDAIMKEVGKILGRKRAS